MWEIPSQVVLNAKSTNQGENVGKKAFRTLDSQMFWVLEQRSRTVGALWTKISGQHTEACEPNKALIQAHGCSSLFQHAAFESTFGVLLRLSTHTLQSSHQLKGDKERKTE